MRFDNFSHFECSDYLRTIADVAGCVEFGERFFSAVVDTVVWDICGAGQRNGALGTEVCAFCGVFQPRRSLDVVAGVSEGKNFGNCNMCASILHICSDYRRSTSIYNWQKSRNCRCITRHFGGALRLCNYAYRVVDNINRAQQTRLITKINTIVPTHPPILVFKKVNRDYIYSIFGFITSPMTC